jgi:hypothetical protein
MESTTRWRSCLATVLALLASGTFVAPAAGQLRANPLSGWPSEIRPGDRVRIVFTLGRVSVHGTDAGVPLDGRRTVAVVIRADGRTRQFPARALGSGRYRAEIVFPAAGIWGMRVRFGAGGAQDEVVLGKGAVCVRPCVEVQATTRTSATDHAGVVTTVFIFIALAISVASAAAVARRRTASGKGDRRPPGPAHTQGR